MFKLQLYQIIVSLLALFMLGYAINQFRRAKKTKKELLIWFIFWGTLLYFALFPAQTKVFAKITGFQDNVNAIIFISLGILFFAVFKIVVALERIEQKLTKIIRREALKRREERVRDS
jgi:hypothetical protein